MSAADKIKLDACIVKLKDNEHTQHQAEQAYENKMSLLDEEHTQLSSMAFEFCNKCIVQINNDDGYYHADLKKLRAKGYPLDPCEDCVLTDTENKFNLFKDQDDYIKVEDNGF